MNALLDTCALLWAARQPERLSAPVRALLLDPHTELTVSVVSAWEIALKPELGIDDVARWFREAARHLHARILPVRLEHIAALEKLPVRHRDPFDRLLIAQASQAGWRSSPPTRRIAKYPAVRMGLDVDSLPAATSQGSHHLAVVLGMAAQRRRAPRTR